MDTFDARLAAEAASSHGVIDNARASLLGAPYGRLKRRSRAGALRRVHPDVYVVGGAPATHEQALLAACLAAGRNAIVSHRAAAWLWGLEGFTRPGPVELTVALGRGPAPRGVILHRTKRFDPVDRTVHRAIPV